MRDVVKKVVLLNRLSLTRMHDNDNLMMVTWSGGLVRVCKVDRGGGNDDRKKPLTTQNQNPQLKSQEPRSNKYSSKGSSSS